MTWDSLVPDQPAYFASADGHTAWVNSMRLEIDGVDNTTVDPSPDGIIVRDDQGKPKETLRETAMGLVARHIPPPYLYELTPAAEPVFTAAYLRVLDALFAAVSDPGPKTREHVISKAAKEIAHEAVD